MYVANPGGDTITPISTAIEEPGQPIVVGPSPDAMAITPDGRTVLVLTSTGITGVTPVDAVANRAGKPVAIQGAYALAVAPDGGTAYVLAMPDPACRRPGRAAGRRREGSGTAGGQPGRQDGLRTRLEHIRRDGSGHTVQNAVQNAAEEAALRPGPGHSDPRRDELRREAHKGGPAPGCHNDRLLNRAGRASRGLVLLSPGQRAVPPSQPQMSPL